MMITTTTTTMARAKAALRWAALLLALLLALPLAGCTNDGPEEDDADVFSVVPDSPPPVINDITPDGRSLDKVPAKTLSFEPAEDSFYCDSGDVEMIEINQNLSYYYDNDTGERYRIKNFAAGKETAVFVDISEALWDQSELVTLTVERNGQFIAQFLPTDYFVQYGRCLVYYHPKNMADADYWAEGAYTFTFEADGVVACRTANFFQTMPIKVLAVPILANYSGRIVGCEGEWQSGGTMLYATYPVARANLDYVLGAELDLSDDMYDLDDQEGQYNVWEALSALQTPNKDYEIIIGFIREKADNGRLCGYTYGLPANIVCESDSDMLATVVHEVAHCYKVGDEYEGGHINNAVNPPPYGMEGRDIVTYEPSAGNKTFINGGKDMGITGTGSVIYGEQRPYWVEGRRFLGDVTSYMGAGVRSSWDAMWTTADIWNHLFYVFTGINGVPESGQGGSSGGFGQCPECYGSMDEPDFYTYCYECDEWTEIDSQDFTCEECGEDGYADTDDIYAECPQCWDLVPYEVFLGGGAAGKAAAAVYAIDITGTFDKNGSFHPTPWYTYEATAADVTARKNGEYSVLFYDDGGKIVSVSCFDVQQKAQVTTGDGSAEFIQADKLPVNVTVKFPENAARIEIVKQDQVLYATDVSKQAPEVAFTGLTDYQQLPDSVTLTWEASGEAGRSLYYELWYCPEEDEYYNLASNITGTSYQADLSSYPGTREGYFYIFATDGVRTGGAASEWVRVPYKAPEIITVQKAIPEVKITEEIILDADIYDMQDGWLWGDEISWTLDGWEYMTGSTLWVWPYELAPGTHTFTCTAVNSAGLASIKEFSFRVLDDQSDLPDDWSRGDIVNALSNGFVLPLSKLDGAVTRGQYAGLMMTLYATLAEEDDAFPEYEEGVVTDCGQDDYSQFLMVCLGIMEAPNGRFEPNKPITEREAALVLWRVMARAVPDVLDFDEDEDIILTEYLDSGIIDADGPNAYNTPENLTNRLALVRLSRLYAALFE